MENATTARIFFEDMQKKYSNLEFRTTNRTLGNSMTIVEYDQVERNLINCIVYQNTMKGIVIPESLAISSLGNVT